MFENLKNVSGLNWEQSREYRALKKEIDALIFEESILKICEQRGSATLHDVKKIIYAEQEILLEAKATESNKYFWSVLMEANALVDAGLLDRTIEPKEVSSTTLQIQRLTITDSGKERLQDIARTLEPLGLRFSELEAIHLSSTNNASHWWDFGKMFFNGP